MAKQPLAGQTKTRLCPPLAAQTAADLYACFLRDTLALMRQVPGIRREICYLPEDAGPYFRDLAPDMALSRQQGADLGERLDNLIAATLRNGAQKVVVIGSDSPNLPAAYISQAFNELDNHDLVLGPCDDGGYYLIGLRRPQPQLLRGVVMSTASVLRDTLEIAEQLRLRTALLPGWYDVDTIGELQRLRSELHNTAPDVAPHTRAFLKHSDL